MGLDETVYGTVRSNLLAQDPLPSLNKIYSTLVQEECVQTMTREKEKRNDVMIFAVQTETRARGKGESRNVVCSNCNCSRHESANCFQLIGYLDWWGERSRAVF